MIADVDVPDAVVGVIGAVGDWNNGWAWYVPHGRLVVTFNLYGFPATIAATEPLGAGHHQLEVAYKRDRAGGGPIMLLVDAAVVGEGMLTDNLPFRWQIGGGGLLIGRDTGFPVCDDYETPFPFTGTINTVTIEIPRLAPRDPRAELAAATKHE